MSQYSNDCKGVNYVANDQGQVMFRRPDLTSTGVLLSTGVVTTALPGWRSQPCMDVYASIDAKGVVTMPTATTVTTATGPAYLSSDMDIL